jgi:dihydrofolate reductase
MLFKLIAALDEKSGIGVANNLPWSLKKDLQHFSTITKKSPPNTKNAIIMGRKTWESFPNETLPGRDNIVLSSNKHLHDNCSHANLYCFSDYTTMHEFCQSQDYGIVWIIGGSSIYNHYISQSYINELVLTRIHAHYICDTFFPRIPEYFIKQYEDTYIDIDRKTKRSVQLSIEYYLKS